MSKKKKKARQSGTPAEVGDSAVPEEPISGKAQRYTRQETSAGEKAVGIFWLSLGALVSVLLELVYLGAWLPLPGGISIMFPASIVIACLFNIVLTRTALLWSRKPIVAAIPTLAWGLGFLALSSSAQITGDLLVWPSLRSVFLFVFGLIGGLVPLLRRQ